MAKLTVELPYHFGWKVKDEREGVVIMPDGTHQEVDLAKQTTDISLYKGDKTIGWWKIIKGNYDDTTEGGWENEGGMALPEVDDNSPREELDNWKERYKGYREYKNEEKSVMKTERFKKVDDATWDKVVKRMRDKEKKEPRRRKND